jgi:iron complex outermembrane receptor protein
MNELYWSVGGNPDLAPERAEKVTGSIGYQQNYMAINAEVFHYQVGNYTLWYPSDLGIWQAQSIGQVNQNGLELSTSIDFRKIGKSFLLPQILANGSLTKATTITESNFLPVGRQLIFIPKYQYFLQARWALPRQWKFATEWQWIGDRYIAFSGNNTLKGYGLWNASIEKRFTALNKQFDLGIRMDNLLNEAYFTLPNFPMPLRSVRISLTAQL